MASFASPDFHTEAALLDQVALLGRKSELRQLIKALTLCKTGQGKAVLLCGNEGIGKSALLETFLDLAQSMYGAQAIVVQTPPEGTPQALFVSIVNEILALSQHILKDTLSQVNTILAPLDIQWTQGDLIRIVALLGLQDAGGGTRRDNAVAIEQLTQVLNSAIPFLKRLNAPIREQTGSLPKLL